jgi:hypothetical protein
VAGAAQNIQQVASAQHARKRKKDNIGRADLRMHESLLARRA